MHDNKVFLTSIFCNWRSLNFKLFSLRFYSHCRMINLSGCAHRYSWPVWYHSKMLQNTHLGSSHNYLHIVPLCTLTSTSHNVCGWRELKYITDGKTDRCGSCYMSLCAICFAAPLVAVRLNYKFVTKSCVFTDHFNQSNFHFCDNTNGLIYFKYIILMP